jgi:peptide/nickel transport system ATP-binding protein
MVAGVIVDRLHVAARADTGVEADILHGISFTVAPGEVLALIGESGSGKTTTALALLGYVRPGCRVRSGSVTVGGVDALHLPAGGVADFRGRRVTYIAQSAAASFNPAQRLIDQVTEGCTIRGQMSRQAAERKAHGLFEELALPDPARIGRRYPHQVSGGQLQRVMAAMALMTDPELIVLDEPTTALDVTTQVEVLRAFRRAVRDRGTTAVYVSHDLAVVAQMADSVVVLQNGRVQEAGRIGQILTAPAHEYTRTLLHAVPRDAPMATSAAAAPTQAAPVLEATAITARYGGPGGLVVLRDVDMQITPGAVLGVIGESGSGKSTLARVLTGLLPAASGSVRLNGKVLAAAAHDRTPEELRQVQIVFQSADTALNPAHTVGRLLERPLQFYHGLSGAARRRRMTELLEMVRLPAGLASRYPGQLSGGQKQRLNLARALAAEPTVLICDEVTSALDTVVGAAVLELLAELRRSLGIAMVFISHDLNTVRALADEVMVMYAGRPVETGGRVAGNAGPVHPYAELLAASVPELRTGWLDGLRPRPPRLGGDTSSPASRLVALDSCAFFERCDVRMPGTCDTEPTPLQQLSRGATIRCCRSEAELAAMQGASFARETMKETL